MENFTAIYLDHNATTPVKPAVLSRMTEILSFPGNASSVHKAGREARKLIEDARGTIAKFVSAGPRDIVVFTGGATEAHNHALRGSGMERILVSAIEPPSVLQAAEAKEIIPVLPNGVVDLDALDKMLTGKQLQTLVSVMLVNNETGVIQPIEEIAKITRRHSALLHTDAVQAAGRIPLDIQKLNADFLTLSAHKMGGPQGVGCLVIANCMAVTPLLRGGNQEKSLRAGTENLAGICGFAKAAEIVSFHDNMKNAVLRDKLEADLTALAPNLKIFGVNAPRVHNTSMFTLPGASSEMQLIALDLAGICVSNGSACSSGTVKPSHVLKAMGATDAEAAASIRVSLGWNTTAEDIESFTKAWSAMYNRVKDRLSAA